jgi:hypothetical protein
MEAFFPQWIEEYRADRRRYKLVFRAARAGKRISEGMERIDPSNLVRASDKAGDRSHKLNVEIEVKPGTDLTRTYNEEFSAEWPAAGPSSGFIALGMCTLKPQRQRLHTDNERTKSEHEVLNRSDGELGGAVSAADNFGRSSCGWPLNFYECHHKPKPTEDGDFHNLRAGAATSSELPIFKRCLREAGGGGEGKGNNPKVVRVRLSVNQLCAIDTVAQTFVVNFQLEASWTDFSMNGHKICAGSKDHRESHKMGMGGDLVTTARGWDAIEHWHPGLEFVDVDAVHHFEEW